MFWFYLPVLIVVAANVTYDISSKSIPGNLNAYAGLTIVYSILAASNFLIFKIMNPAGSILAEWGQINWAVILLALSSIGLESGYIFLFRAGWNISIGGLVCNILLVISMLIIGVLLFNETISLRQFLGVLLCIAGLFLITRADFKGKPDEEDVRDGLG